VTPPALEIADLIRTAGAAFVERNRQWIGWKHVKVLLAIARCRTAALGGHFDECTRCAHRAPISYNSCRDRHCPSVRSLLANGGLPHVDENCSPRATCTWSSHSPATWPQWCCRTKR
jgi:hypothetical protein